MRNIREIDGNAMLAGADDRELVSFSIAGQLFGIAVLEVRDVLRPQPISRISLAPPDIVGSLNLRGRIVTAIDICHRLGLSAAEPPAKRMSIVVEHGDELYALIVDSIGDVLSLSAEDYERNPVTLNPRWREISAGIYRLESGLLVVVDIARLLGFLVKSK